MKKKALRKDFFMEIKKSLPRFISIFFIVALGVAFYSGIRSSKNDMMISADKYYDETNLMDVKVMSTLGLTDDDITEISKVNGVEKAEGSYSADLFCETGENFKPVVKVMSILDDMNKVNLTKGKMPSNDKECIVDSSFAKTMNYKIGDKISLKAGNDDNIKDTLKNTEFTIAGMANSSMYLSNERGKSKLGTGKINGFIFINKSSFSSKAYTEIYIKAKDAEKETAYYDGYNKKIDSVVSNVKKIASERENARKDQIVKDAEKEIKDSEEKLNNSKKEAEDKLNESKKKLDDGKNQIDSSKKTIEAKENELSSGRKEIENNKAKIQDSKDKISSGKSEISKKKAELSENEKQLNEGLDKINEAINQLNAQNGIPLVVKEIKLKELESQKASLLEKKNQLESGKNQIAAKEKELEKVEAEISSSESKIKDAENKINNGEKEIAAAKEKISSSEKQLNENVKKYNEEKKKAEDKIEEAKKKIEDSKKKINDIETPKWYVLDRTSLTAYSDYGDNAEKIGAIGEVFPAIFFLVAALVSLTTMTRMVEEERTEIGTLKALGYSKGSIAAKYILYAFIASSFGSILGFLIGERIFPFIIIISYKMMYSTLLYIETPINWYYAVTASLIAVCCTTLVTFAACYKQLMSNPAKLMRPEAPKAGKRIFLEKIPFIWKRLNFTMKSTLRNLLRYKKRFFMTTFGIAGCMALLLVGFGIKDSISDIVSIQYKDISTYDAFIAVNSESSSDEKKKLYETLNSNSNVKKYIKSYLTSVDASCNNKTKSVDLFVPESRDDFSDFVKLHDRQTKEEYKLDDNGVVITEKLAKMLDIKVNDKIDITDGDNNKVSVKVNAICENYINHYIYMSENTYKTLFSKDIDCNEILTINNNTDKSSREKFSEELLKNKSVSTVMFNKQISESVGDMLERLNIVVYVLIISAGLLAFIVLYNLINININERQRELATIKVLGFYDNEVASYVYRENVLLTIIGSIFGLVFGIILHKYVITTVEVESVMFGRNIKFMSFIYSLLLTYLFSAMVNFSMYFKLKKIDMIESLKSVE